MLESSKSKYGELSIWFNKESFRSNLERANHIVVVPPTQTFQQALPRIRKILSQNTGVWIFANGITLPGVAPEWLRRDDVIFTEFGMLASDKSRYLMARERLNSFFDELCATADCPEFSRPLLAGAQSRILGVPYSDVPVISEIQNIVGGRTLHFTKKEWGVAIFFQPSIPVGRFWQIRLSGAWILCMILTGWRALLDSCGRRRLLKCVRELRDSAPIAPRCWIMLHHEWYHLGHHLLESVAKPLLDAGKSVGFLLAGDLLPGHRCQDSLRREGNEWFSGLGPFREKLGVSPLDQVAVPEGAASMVKTYVRCLGVSFRLLRILISGTGELTVPYLKIPLSQVIFELSKLLTIDLFRICLGQSAARQVVERSLKGSPLIFSVGQGSVGMMQADVEMQRAGYRTLDLCHGAGICVPPLCHSVSSQSLVWTEPDARFLRRLDYQAIEMGMPVRAERKTHFNSGPWNLLICSSYCHRDTKVDGIFPLIVFQNSLLSLPALLDRAKPGGFRYRWRPHPADSKKEVARTLSSQNAHIEISKDSLASDLQWADLVVSNFSSVIFETLSVNVPVFVHVLPQNMDTEYANSFDPDRRFFYIEDAVRQISTCFKKGQMPSTCPEQKARVEFFGATECPRSIVDVDGAFSPVLRP